MTPITDAMAVRTLTSAATAALTLGPLISVYLTRRRRQGTYTTESLRSVGPRLDTLAISYGRRPLDRFGHRAIERWLESLEHLTPNSRASYLASTRQFTRWLNVEGYTPSDACAEIPKAKRSKSVPRSLTADQVPRVFSACQDERDLVIAWLMYGCGLRRAEAAGSRWDDYDSAAELLLVHGKGDKERIVPVPRAVSSSLSVLRVANSGPILRSKHDGRSGLTPATVGSLMSQVFWRSGVKVAAWDGMSGHALRHTCATEVLDSCHDLRAVQELLGHDSLQSTQIYLGRFGAERLRTAMESRRYPDGHDTGEAA